jgi:hypothetical protein
LKKLLFSLILLSSLPAFASPPFKYQTKCFLQTKEELQEDICTVVETRESNGALKTRNIYSNKWQLTIKGRFDESKGYMTWDSHNKFEYKWEYKIANIPNSTSPYTYVMPGVILESVSWD